MKEGRKGGRKERKGREEGRKEGRKITIPVFNLKKERKKERKKNNNPCLQSGSDKLINLNCKNPVPKKGISVQYRYQTIDKILNPCYTHLFTKKKSFTNFNLFDIFIKKSIIQIFPGLHLKQIYGIDLCAD